MLRHARANSPMCSLRFVPLSMCIPVAFSPVVGPDEQAVRRGGYRGDPTGQRAFSPWGSPRRERRRTACPPSRTTPLNMSDGWLGLCTLRERNQGYCGYEFKLRASGMARKKPAVPTDDRLGINAYHGLGARRFYL